MCLRVCVWWSWFSTSRRYVSFLHCFCSKVVVSTKWMFQDNGAFIVLALFVIRIRRRGRSSWMLLPVIWEACASLGSKSELFSVSFLLGSGFCLQTDNRKAVCVCTCAHVCVCVRELAKCELLLEYQHRATPPSLAMNELLCLYLFVTYSMEIWRHKRHGLECKV